MMANRPMTNSTEAMMKLLRRSFVVSRRIMPSDITNEMVVDTISGEKLRFNIYNTVSYSFFILKSSASTIFLTLIWVDPGDDS
jgi:hypothetical protein